MVVEFDPVLLDLEFGYRKKLHDAHQNLQMGSAKYEDGYIVFGPGEKLLVDPYDTKESKKRRERKRELEEIVI